MPISAQLAWTMIAATVHVIGCVAGAKRFS
jgi:hypothetical protein